MSIVIAVITTDFDVSDDDCVKRNVSKETKYLEYFSKVSINFGFYVVQ